MLDRIEAERRDATGRVLAGQEAERLRIAQELHDQVGQQLTAVLLVLSRVRSARPESCEARCSRSRPPSRSGLEDVRWIAIEFRPEALDDLGLESALAVLCERFAERTGSPSRQRVGPDLAPMSREAELVVYRVAQEALTNIVRHSRSAQAAVTLKSVNGLTTLTVHDVGAASRGPCSRGRHPRHARACGIDRRQAEDRRQPRGVGDSEVRLEQPRHERGQSR